MADKYIIHGATYCGNGTASNEAASAGAAGAWNDINVLEGTAPAQGTAPAAGDTVYIRSKTSAGADITRTLAASAVLGSSSATAAQPITWVIDGGIKWPGVAGKLTYECPATYVITLRNYNRFVADVEDTLIIKEMNTAPSYKGYLGGNGIYIKNVLCDFSTTVPTGGNGSELLAFGEASLLENLHITSRKIPQRLIQCSTYTTMTLINPRVELFAATAGVPIFMSSSTGGYFTVIGGSLTGAGATSAVPLIYQPGQGIKFRLYGFQFPNEMPISQSSFTVAETTFHSTGSDGLCGSRIKEAWGESNSRTDTYLPTLNAQLPDSVGTKWSLWIYPTGANRFYPAYFEFGKVFTDTAGARGIELEILIATAFVETNAGNVWMSVTYTEDSTGLQKYVSTRNASSDALTTSDAAWYPDPPTYGATAYSRKVLSVETPTAIQQDTLIHVVLFISVPATSASRSVIVCPDFVVVAP